MTKVTAAIIQQDEKVLLMRRDTNQSFAGKWEFPGGKVEPNEKLAQCMKRELREELGIDATVGNILTSVKTPNFEIFAYNIPDFTGNIQLKVHDALQWIHVWDIEYLDLLEADKKIAKNVFNYAYIPDLDTQAHTFALKHVCLPRFNESVQLWHVSFIQNGIQSKKHFFSHYAATEFYMKRIHALMHAFKRNRYIEKLQNII